MDDFFMENLCYLSFDDLLSLFIQGVGAVVILALLISFISWAFWFLVRTFRHIVSS